MTSTTLTLETDINDVTTIMEPLSEQHDKVLEIFEEGKLLETLFDRLPEPHIVDNILEIYSYTFMEIFEVYPDEDEAAIKARIAFPLLIDRLAGAVLSFETLYNLWLSCSETSLFSDEYKDVIWGVVEDQKIANQIKAIFDAPENFKSLQLRLNDPHLSHADAIEIAVGIYGEDKYDLQFEAIKALPEIYLDKFSFDLRNNSEHAARVVEWGSAFFQSEGVNIEAAPQNILSKKQSKVLSNILNFISSHKGVGENFVQYALACDNRYLISSAEHVLKAWGRDNQISRTG